MKRFLTVWLVSAFFFGLAGVASADSPWMTKANAKQYADVYLGASGKAYPTAIECKLVNRRLMIRFRTKTGKKPFNKWQFTSSRDPLAELRRIHEGYRIVSSSKFAQNLICGLGYR